MLQFATEAREGEEVIALGYPFGYELGQSMTITTGIVSAFRTSGGVAYIQTDSDINFGNSGGPLLNLRGEVVGMNTAGLRDRDAQGINFAIRYDVLASRLPALLRTAARPPTVTPTPTPTSKPQPLFGPVDGEIEHEPDDAYLEAFNSRTSIRHGVLEARFFVPYSTEVGNWSCGFMFRYVKWNDLPDSQFHIVLITSWNNFHHYLRTGGPMDSTPLALRNITGINTSPGDSNHVRLIINGAEGMLYVNSRYVAKLNLSGLITSGEVRAVGEYFSDDGVAGYSTRFKDFTIWPLSALR